MLRQHTSSYKKKKSTITSSARVRFEQSPRASILDIKLGGVDQYHPAHKSKSRISSSNMPIPKQQSTAKLETQDNGLSKLVSDIKKRISYTSVAVPNHSSKVRQRYGSKDQNTFGQSAAGQKDSKTEDALYKPPNLPKDFEPVLGSIDANKNRLKLKPAAAREFTSEAAKTPPKVHLLEKRLLNARDILSTTYNDTRKKRVVPIRRLEYRSKESDKS